MDINRFKVQLLYAGSQHVLPYIDTLNNMNVFPIPDGDTGSNLAYLFRAIIDFYEHTDLYTNELNELILLHSKGNSGAIFSQFFLSFLQEFSEHSIESFQKSIVTSVARVYDSIENPKKGTVLDVMDTFSHSLNHQVPSSLSIIELIEVVLPEMEKAMNQTMYEMPLLLKHNVVDAGAYAFYLFIKGMTLNPSTTVTSKKFSTNMLPITEHEIDFDMRYCTEFVLKHVSSFSEIKKVLVTLGTSLSVVGDENMCRIHLHTDNPEQVAFFLKTQGEIRFQKVDDMKRQYEVKQKQTPSIALVIDSACDLPIEFQDLYHIHLLPLQIELDHVTYLDKQTLTSQTFYDQYEQTSSQPKTAQPSLKKVKELYTWLADHYDHVISLHVSKELSGTYHLCKQAAKEVNYNQIHVVDSKNLSGSYGLIALKMAEMIQQNETIETILKACELYKERTEILVSVPTLKYMIKGGRVSPILGKIGNLLNLKPIVSLNQEGGSLLYGQTFFRKSNITKLLTYVQKIHTAYKIEDYVLLHANNPNLLQTLEENMKMITDKNALYTSNVSPVIGIHAGKGSVGIAMLLKEKNKRELR